MPRPLLAGGLVALVIGSLLLALGLDWGRGEVGAAASSMASHSSPTESTPVVASPSESAKTTQAPVPVPESVPSHSPASTPTAKQHTPSAAPAGMSLAVSAIDLDVSLTSGGVDSSGKVNPPAGRAMWVRGYGRVRPGDVGTAVVAGHVVSSGHDDVFAHLPSIRDGDRVLVRTGAVTRTYVVSRAVVVKKEALTHDADVWGQNTSTRRIVLITCDDELGFRSDGHRVANYVVVADAI